MSNRNRVDVARSKFDFWGFVKKSELADSDPESIMLGEYSIPRAAGSKRRPFTPLMNLYNFLRPKQKPTKDDLE